MRVTTHNGRINAHGQAYSPRHNDRNFEEGIAFNIDSSRSDQNQYWRCIRSAKTNEECELLAYENWFSDGLKARNKRYIKQGHQERIQTMEGYLKNPRTCPDETILQIGDISDSASPELLLRIAVEHINWQIQNYRNIKILDVALHCDESTPHIHIRKTYIGHDRDGNCIANQRCAFEEMGIERPHPDMPRSRYNNEKQTYTQLCRNNFMECCANYGLKIEDVPRDTSASGLELLEYKRRREEERLNKIRDELQELAGMSDFDAKISAATKISDLTNQILLLQQKLSNNPDSNCILDFEKTDIFSKNSSCI